MVDKIVQFGRRMRRRLSRTGWTAKLLKRRQRAATDEPGLILLQIDGLSRRQLELACAKGRLPFLRRMIERGHYQLAGFYSGCPSTTPAVQGEVMYGVKCAVPAFQFFDRDTGRVVRMFDAAPVHAVAERLAAEHPPLLDGGRSYSNIFSGGAEEARFCAETLPVDQQQMINNPLQMAGICLMYLSTVLRVAALAVLELVIAIGDVIRGVLEREDWRTEAKFIASRVGVSIVLREYLRVMTKLAVEEGAPVIYANFLGYDEQAHRRGPESWFAHWVLKGIDGVIRDISSAARRSRARDYEVIVFSDHGQERTRFYDREQGCSIEQAVRDEFAEGPLAGRLVHRSAGAVSGTKTLHERSRHLVGRGRKRREAEETPEAVATDEIVVTALGPLGHIYVPTAIGDEAKANYARRLVSDRGVPLVVYLDEAGECWAINGAGRWLLPRDAEKVLGAHHPYLQEAAEDLAALCHTRNAGDLVISGWEPGRQPMTFVMENGSHGSVGADEVRGFALVPDGVPAPRRETATGEAYLRGVDLYWAGREFLGEVDETRPRPAAVSKPAGIAMSGAATASMSASSGEQPRDTFRVMTYNVHSCIGLDGKARPERILQVIRSAGADVIALQEVDSNRPRSRHADQARFLAERLEMSHHYYAVFEECGEQYGLAIISRWPLEHVQSSHLTAANARKRCEARGAMWVQVDAPWAPLQIINTHFGLRREERRRQAAELVSERWLGRLRGDEHVALCGDLNSGGNSAELRILAATLRDVQTELAGHRPRATFPSPLPVRRLDHILVSRSLAPQRVMQVRTPTAVVASDHLPVCVDLSPFATKSGCLTASAAALGEGVRA
jgi:endonuclease/exonuclease/phosphatase family metal-dependent hydrolase